MDGYYYTVKQGDNLSVIAHKHGLTIDEIYNHSKNSFFRRLRPDKTKIYPKDSIYIPAPAPSTLATANKNADSEFYSGDTPITNRMNNLIRTQCPIYWLALQHSISFPDDLGQIIPAEGAHYRVKVSGVVFEGYLDKNGFTGIKPIIEEAAVHVEYEPDIDAEIEALQKKLKTVLDQVIEEERKESDVIEKRLEKQEWWENALEYRIATDKGVINGIVGMVEGVVSMGEVYWDFEKSKIEFIGKYVLDPLNAPETFKKDVAEIKETYENVSKFIDEDLETYFILITDEETWNILETFALDYIDAQHSLELTEASGEVVFNIVLAIVTGGGGAAAIGAKSSVRLANIGKKLSALFKKLIKLLKRRRAKFSKGDYPNKVVETERKNFIKNTETPKQKSKNTRRVAPAKGNYRGRYNAERHKQGKPRLPDDYDAHHKIPQEYREHSDFKDFDFDQPDNIIGVKGSRADVNTHQKITNEWAEFKKSKPKATRSQIEDFAKEIDKKYKEHWFK